MRRFLPGIVAVAVAAPLHAQSLNVDFGGSAATAPSASYRAAGGAGTWNSIGVLEAWARVPLVNADGSSTGVEVYMFGGTSLQLLESDIPEASGDDAALLDDMLIGRNDPVDVCVWVDHVANNDYEVLIYALTPGDPSRQCRVRVDDATPGPQMVGGAWSGTHSEFVTYGRHTVTVTNNRIGLHSGLYNGYIQSGINGIQIRPLSAVGVAPNDLDNIPGLRGVHPNPARGRQVIEYVVNGSGAASVEIFDAAGRAVWRRALQSLPAGRHTLEWSGIGTDGNPLPSGVYFVRLATPSSATTWKKLVRVD